MKSNLFLLTAFFSLFFLTYTQKTIPKYDFIHDNLFFMKDPNLSRNLSYGSPELPRHLYDLKSNREFPFSPNLNSVLPPGLTFNGYNPVTLENSVVQMVSCATQLNGYEDKDLGVFNLEPNLYCNPLTTRFIPGLTCCAPQPPDQIAVRLLLFKPKTSQVTELDFRARRRPNILPDTGKIVYLIHGYLDNVTDSKWIQPVARAWNQRGASVIAVDWKFGCQDFFQATSNVRTVGAVVGLSIVNWRVSVSLVLSS